MDNEPSPLAKWVLALGVVLVSFNFRTPITSISPVLEIIQADLHLGYASTSLLTAVPTLCFGAFAFGAAPVARRIGRERGVLWAMVLLGIGTTMRIWGHDVAVLYLTTVVVGAGIAVSQTVLPSIISEYFADNAAFATGLYTTALTAGAGVASGATPVLRDRLGSWTLALGAWGVPVFVAVAVWVPVAITDGDEHERRENDASLPWFDPWAWVLAIFFGLQSLLFYTTVTWLAPRYIGLGWTTKQAGYLLTSFFVGQFGGTFGLAPLSDRWHDRRPWVGLVLVLCCVGFAAITFVPVSHPWLWALLLGAGLGGIFTLNMTLPVDFTPTPDAANRLTSMMVGVGYFVAALGPFLGGVIRDRFGSTRPTFLVLLVTSVLLLGLTVTLRPSHRIT